MTNQSRPIALALVFYLLVVAFTPVSAQEGTPGAPGMAVFEIDEFTYRASFQASDGAELFLIRSSYKLRYLYQHHHPTINHHYMRISVGFYFGKTLLGRSLVESVEFDELAFYAKWIDSAGYSFDLKGVEGMFTISDSVEDGKLLTITRLLDDDARSRYLPLFGGTYVFTDLKITLIDQSVIEYGDLEIEVEKHNNEFTAREAKLSSNSNLTYESDSKYIQVSSSVATPVIAIVDTVIGISLFGAAGTFALLILLHVRGRIELPIDRFKGILHGQQNADEEFSSMQQNDGS